MTIEEHYKQLEGFKLSNFKYIEEYGEQLPTFTITQGKEKYTLVVSRDPEGNGAGFLHIDNYIA